MRILFVVRDAAKEVLKVAKEVVHEAHHKLLVFGGHRVTKSVLLHTSVTGFGADFFNAVVGEHMVIFHHLWMLVREPTITWAAFAAGLYIYCDNATKAIEAFKAAKGG